jgi:hypothetical protein
MLDPEYLYCEVGMIRKVTNCQRLALEQRRSPLLYICKLHINIPCDNYEEKVNNERNHFRFYCLKVVLVVDLLPC